MFYLQMILPTYVRDAWLENSFGSWKQRCQNAHSAESVEILTKVATLFLLYCVVCTFARTGVVLVSVLACVK